MTSRERSPAVITALLAASGLTASFALTLIIPIQIELPRLLGADLEDTAWALTAALLASAIITPVSGRLGDIYGKRRIIVVLLGCLILGSVVAGLTGSLGGIIVGRVLQGVAVGVIPLGMSSLRDHLAHNQLDPAVAMVSSTLGVGGAISLPIGAAVSQFADWKALFWMSAALGVIVLLLVVTLLPESPRQAVVPFDWWGTAGLVTGLTSALIAISRGNSWGWASPVTLCLLAGSAAVFLFWARHQMRHPYPLVNLRIAARPAVLLTNLASIAVGFALFTTNVVYPQLLQTPVELGGYGQSILEAGLVCMPLGLVMMIVAPIGGRLTRHVGPRVPFIMGTALTLLAYVYLLLRNVSVWDIVIASAITGIGVGFGFAAMPSIIMRSVPVEETGSSNGINTLFRSIGTSAAGAVIGAVLAGASFSSGGNQIVTPEGFNLALVMGAVAAAVAVLLSIISPRGRAITVFR